MTQSNEIEIAILKTDMANIAKDISDIKTDIKAIVLQMNKQPSLEAEIISLKKELQEAKKVTDAKLEKIEKSSNLWKWLAPTLTALATAILSVTLTFLWMNYIQNIAK